LSPLAGIPEKGLAKAAQFMQKLQLSEMIRTSPDAPAASGLFCVSGEIKLSLNRPIFTNKDWTFYFSSLLDEARGIKQMKFIVIVFPQSLNCWNQITHYL